VEAAYQRRADLVPNLVEVVKGYATMNRRVQGVTEARARLDLSRSPRTARQSPGHGKVPGCSISTRRRIIALLVWPNNTQSEGKSELPRPSEPARGNREQDQCGPGEIQQVVQDFNTSIRTFPNSLTNSLLLHLTRKEPFKADRARRWRRSKSSRERDEETSSISIIPAASCLLLPIQGGPVRSHPYGPCE